MFKAQAGGHPPGCPPPAGLILSQKKKKREKNARKCNFCVSQNPAKSSKTYVFFASNILDQHCAYPCKQDFAIAYLKKNRSSKKLNV